MARNKKAPPGWGDDSLTTFIDDVRDNQFATFVHHPLSKRLIKIDSVLAPPLAKSVNPDPFMPMLFIHRAHSAFRAAASMAMAGQVYETFAQIRSGLESASYGIYIGSNAERFKTWCSRGDDKKAKQAVRDEFKQGRIKASLTSLDQSLADEYAILYEATIDLGAHPNELGFLSSMRIKKSASDRAFEQVYMHGNSPQLESALITLYRMGMWILHAFQLLWPDIAKAHGIDSALLEMKSNPYRRTR